MHPAPSRGDGIRHGGGARYVKLKALLESFLIAFASFDVLVNSTVTSARYSTGQTGNQGS